MRSGRRRRRTAGFTGLCGLLLVSQAAAAEPHGATARPFKGLASGASADIAPTAGSDGCSIGL